MGVIRRLPERRHRSLQSRINRGTARFYDERVPLSVVDVHSDVHKSVHTSQFPKFFAPERPGQSRDGAAEAPTCRRRPLTARSLPARTQWIWPAPRGRPGCASSPLRRFLDSPGQDPRWRTGRLRTASASVWCPPRGILLRWWRPLRGASAFERWDALRTDEGDRDSVQRRWPTRAPAHRLWSAERTSATTTGSFS